MLHMTNCYLTIMFIAYKDASHDSHEVRVLISPLCMANLNYIVELL